MVLSAGKVDHFFRHGVDGIIDVSPFSCMNGIVSEALYPRVSRDHADLPIKSVYVDGTEKDLTAELEIFVELARAYQQRKPHARRFPGHVMPSRPILREQILNTAQVKEPRMGEGFPEHACHAK